LKQEKNTMSHPRIPTRRFGSAGQQVSTIGQGTWMIEEQAARAVAAMQHGMDIGLTHIDTAEMYGNGAAERLVASAIEGRREQVFLVSKVLPSNASLRGTIAACEASLQRLRTDCLDCYLLHWRGAYPLAETFEAFELLKQQGKIRSYGVSNFDVDDLDEALALLGPGKLACNQVLYHLQERAIEHAVLPWCRRNEVAVVAYSPFGHNAFPSPTSKGGAVLAKLATEHGVTPQQLALAFLCREPDILPIPKSTNIAHLTANADAARLHLPASTVVAIDAAFPLGRKPRGLPMI
jgi:diketogulonate reductase-like aldo/keto reductase